MELKYKDNITGNIFIIFKKGIDIEFFGSEYYVGKLNTKYITWKDNVEPIGHDLKIVERFLNTLIYI